MASSEILSQTLFSITNIKLEQLKKQKGAYESAKRSLLEDADQETGTQKRAKVLVAGAGKLPSMTLMEETPMLSLRNLRRIVQQADFDPSVSEELLADCEKAMRNELDVQSTKYRFAELYGKLVNEWIAAGGDSDADGDVAMGPEISEGSEGSEGSSFVPVGREEMHEQRKTWEEYVFKAKETDTDAIRAYLEDLFINSNKDVERAFRRLREAVAKFQELWDQRTHFTEQTLTNSIRGLLRTDILSDQKRKTLTDFLANKTVLQEITDVLNMRMQSRKTWEWEGANIIDQRRQLNGRYRFYPDEDLLQMIFIHYVGLQWCVFLRDKLTGIVSTPGCWKSPTARPSKEELRRRGFFLRDRSEGPAAGSVDAVLEKHFQEEILLDQLPDHEEEQRGGYGEGGADGDRRGDSRKSHARVMQNLLHLLQSCVIIDTQLGREVTVLRTDFKWFGPSIPHSTIFAVLAFLGVGDEWLDVFRRFLEAPIRFAQDPADAAPQVRRRGTPLSTPVADFFAESMLFCLDFAVNQRAGGLRLYRLHDDIWAWGGVEPVRAAWRTMKEFAALMGLEFNQAKTGCARVPGLDMAPAPVPSDLPVGDVTWGFLRLDPTTGRFGINQPKVEGHIAELRRQLAACRSVLDWIQAWNIYGSRFFATNLGALASCYSRAHVDDALATFARIQRGVFGGEGGAGAALRAMIGERFGIPPEEIPDGYLYYPPALGGLGLRNPFVPLYLLRDDVALDPAKAVRDFLEEEAAAYRRKKAAYDEEEAGGAEGRVRHHFWRGTEYADLAGQPFMAPEEFVRHRAWTSEALGRTLAELRREPRASGLEVRGEMQAAVGEGEWTEWMEEKGRDGDYEQWVCALYAKDMIARFGSMAIVEKGLLPMGLMEMLKQSRFRWQG